MTVRTGRNVRSQEHFLLHLAIATSLVTSFFYDHLPAALPVMMICAALVLRDRKEADRAREAVDQQLASSPIAA